jgi:hypothetical protein|tara:strand:+ start:516 stop:659 length:144 start_codon:yes stop_codon:yes gene_type:complete
LEIIFYSDVFAPIIRNHKRAIFEQTVRFARSYGCDLGVAKKDGKGHH